MTEERKTGFIKRLNFKRTWGILADNSEEEYYFDLKDINMDAFAIREGLAVNFEMVEEDNANARTRFRAVSIMISET